MTKVSHGTAIFRNFVGNDTVLSTQVSLAFRSAWRNWREKYQEEPNWENIHSTIEFRSNEEKPFLHVTLREKSG